MSPGTETKGQSVPQAIGNSDQDLSQHSLAHFGDVFPEHRFLRFGVVDPSVGLQEHLQQNPLLHSAKENQSHSFNSKFSGIPHMFFRFLHNRLCGRLKFQIFTYPKVYGLLCDDQFPHRRSHRHIGKFLRFM